MMKLSCVIGIAGLFLSASVQADISLNPGQLLEEQNQVRAAVNLPPLVWSEELVTRAQAQIERLQMRSCRVTEAQEAGISMLTEGAQQTALSKDDRGETRWGVQARPMTAKKVVERWAREANWYNAAQNICSAPEGESCMNYLQMVRKDVQAVGCANTVCTNHAQAWVCAYGAAESQ